MANFIDAFGSTVTDNHNGSWTRGGVTIWVPTQAQALNTFNGMAPDGWNPSAPATTQLPGWVVWGRFTQAEQAALLAYQSGVYVATAISLATSPALSNQDPAIIADFATLVSNGLLTSARSTQILNFAVSSP